MSKNIRQLLPILVVLIAILLTASAVFANSAMPPNRYWFKFTPDISTLTLQSFKVVQCSSAIQCQPPKLVVINYAMGSNNYQPSEGFKGSSFQYADNLFLWSMFDYGAPKDSKYFQIVGKYLDSQDSSVKLLSSNIFYLGSPLSVKVSDQKLVVQAQEKDPTENRILRFFKFESQAALSILLLMLSVGSELAIAFLLLRKFNFSRTELSSVIAVIILMHGFSLPIVWKSFPSFAVFASPGERGSGAAWLVLSLFYPLLLFNKNKPLAGEKSSVRSIAYLSILDLFFTWILSGAFWILNYSDPNPESVGLSSTWVIPLAEIFVWLYEAWILWIVTRPHLSRLQALMLSLVMNVVSFGLGSTFIALFFG